MSRRIDRKARRQRFGGTTGLGFYSFRLVTEAHWLGARYLFGGKRWAIVIVRTDPVAAELGKEHLDSVKKREVLQ